MPHRSPPLTGAQAPGDALTNVVLGLIVVFIFEAGLFEVMYVTVQGAAPAIAAWSKRKGLPWLVTAPAKLFVPSEWTVGLIPSLNLTVILTLTLTFTLSLSLS